MGGHVSGAVRPDRAAFVAKLDSLAELTAFLRRQDLTPTVSSIVSLRREALEEEVLSFLFEHKEQISFDFDPSGKVLGIESVGEWTAPPREEEGWGNRLCSCGVDPNAYVEAQACPSCHRVWPENLVHRVKRTRG
jgi:hypothetical protein